MTRESGEFRVVHGSGAETEYADTEHQARTVGAKWISTGTTSQVVVERLEGNQWVPIEIHKGRI